MTDRAGNTVRIERDEVEFNPSRLVEPSGRALTLAWRIGSRDQAIRVTDPLGRTVQYEYDVFNRLTAVTDPAGGVTRYGYDGQGRMTTVTDARGITYVTNTYDTNSRVCQQTGADSGVFTLYYVTADIATTPEPGRTAPRAA